MSESRSKQVVPRTLPCDIAVLFRDAESAGGMIDRLRDTIDLRGSGFSIRLGRLGERVVALGVATKLTSLVAMTDAIVTAHKPQLIVIGTFGVGLAEGLAANTVLLAGGLVAERTERLELPPGTESSRPRGLLWATNRLASPPIANALAAIPQDFFAVAKWCRERNLGLEIIAVITRHATDQPPADVRQILNQPSLAGRLGAFLGAAWRRPGSVPDLWHQKEAVWIARERLADAIESLIAPAN